MDGDEYLRKTAQRCFALAGRCYHLEVARDLRRLGDELAAKAAQAAEVERAARPATGEPARPARDSARQRRHPATAKLADIAARIAAVFGPIDHRRDAPSRRGY